MRSLRAEMGKGASKYIAGAAGVSQRTAERWIAKAEGRASQASTPKPMAQVNVVEQAKRYAAAKKLRAAQVVHAGRVEVAYADDGRNEGGRNVGGLPVTGTLQTAMGAAADAVERGDYAAASELLDAGVMDAYGVPEGTLEVSDYLDGFSID